MAFIGDWMFVELDADGRRGKVYVKGGEVEGEEEDSELVIRLQGVVHDINLNMTGDWDRMEDNAKKAVQRLTLVSGGCTAAFEPQCIALANIREMVGLMLGLCPSRRGRSSSINLRRRVFTKVVSTDPDVSASAVFPGEDPSGLLDVLASRWWITSRLRCGTQDEEGELVHFNPLLIRAGDLVDVSVTVAVVLKKTSFGRKYDVIFEPSTVVRLRSARSMKILLSPREEHRVSQVPNTKAKGKMVEGFSFRATWEDKSSVEIQGGM